MGDRDVEVEEVFGGAGGFGVGDIGVGRKLLFWASWSAAQKANWVLPGSPVRRRGRWSM